MKISGVNLIFLLVLLLSACHSNSGPPAWEYVGPAQITGISNDAPCAGRIDAIAVSGNYDGNGSQAMYITGPGSGIWRSTDFTSDQPTWKCLTDHIQISNDAATDLVLRQNINDIRNIVVDPTNVHRIYAGTNSSKSVILFSKDGGDSWSVIPASAFGNAYGVTHLFVDPTGILYVLLDQSFWKQDAPGGVTFTNLGSPGTSEPAKPFPFKSPYINFQDAVYTIALTGRLEHIYIAVVETNAQQAAHTGIWSFDYGVWKQMPIKMTNIQGLPFSNADVLRIRLYSDLQSGVVAAMTSDNGKLRNLKGALLNVFKLTYNSKIKKRIWYPAWASPTLIINTGASSNDMGTCIDHNGVIYSGGIGLAQSDKNGNVVPVQPHGGCQNCDLHVDEHVVMEWDGNIYVGTDGGLFRFNPVDYSGGYHDFHSLNSPSLGNFLSTSVDRNNYAATFIIGNHDNALVFVDPSGSRYCNFSNEDEYARFVPYIVGIPDKQTAYSFTPANGFYKSVDGGRSFAQININIPLTNARFCFKPTEKGRMLMTVENNLHVNGVNAVLHTVYETRDDWNSSRDIIGANLRGKGPISALSYAGDRIVVASGKAIYESSDDGATWYAPWEADANIVSICSDPSDPKNIYIATSGSGKNEIPGKVFHCSMPANEAQLWTTDDLTGDIPGVITQLNILSRGPAKWPYLFAALKNGDPSLGIGGPGLYQGIVGRHKKTRWKPFGTGLPDSEIKDIQIIPINAGIGKILVATYGRGAWQTELTDP